MTVGANGGRRRFAQIEVHTSTTLTDHDLCVVDGVPCTTVARSIVDAAGHLSRPQMANMLAAAERASLLHLASIREVLERVRSRPTSGYKLLVDVLTEHLDAGAQLSRSEVEASLRDIAVQAGLPAPQLNRVIAGDEVDAVWPDVGLAVEIDSWAFHRDRRAFVSDRAKLRRLFLRGFVVLPYAAADVVHRPRLVAAELIAARAHAESRVPPRAIRGVSGG